MGNLDLALNSRSIHVCLDGSSSSSTCPNNNRSLRWSTAEGSNRYPLVVRRRLALSLPATAWSIPAASWSIFRLLGPTSMPSRTIRLLGLASPLDLLGPETCPATPAAPNLVRVSKTRTMVRVFFRRTFRTTCSIGPIHEHDIDHSHSCKVGDLAFRPSALPSLYSLVQRVWPMSLPPQLVARPNSAVVQAFLDERY